MARYLYHYATNRSTPGGYTVTDGTLDLAWMVDSSARYQEIRATIAAEIGTDHFVITSLTLLNPPMANQLQAAPMPDVKTVKPVLALEPHPQCSKCGLSLTGVMSYSCSRIGCPTGLGGATATPG